MAWGDELWDNEKKIAAHTDEQIEHTNKVRHFMQAVVAAEASFAKEIRKLVKSYADPAKPGTMYPTHLEAWQSLLQEVDDIAKQHEYISENLSTMVCDNLKSITKEAKNDRQKRLQDIDKFQSEFEKGKRKYDSVKKAYEKAAKDASDAVAKFAKANQDDNMTKSKMEKIKAEKEKAQHESEQARDTLILETSNLNKCRKKHIFENCAEVFNAMQSAEASLIQSEKDYLLVFVSTLKQTIAPIESCIANIEASVNKIDPNGDTSLFCSSIKTGLMPSDDVVMTEALSPVPTTNLSVQQINEKRVTKKKFFHTTTRKKDAVREDFGHLPPEQRKNAIQDKLSQLTSEHNIESKTFAGMQKTVELYTSQPDFGDAKSLEKAKKEMQIAASKVEKLEAEIYKFQLYLSAIEGTAAPDAPNGYRSNSCSSMNASISSESHFQPSPPQQLAESEEEEDDYEDADNSYLPPPPPSMAAPPPPPQVLAYASAIYDFAGTNQGELAIAAGEQLSVIENDGSGWVRVASAAGEGYVPLSYVEFES